MTDISLSIVTHNDEATIAKAIDSILRYWPKSLSRRIIVVDNASTDKTLEVLSGYPQVEVLPLSENIGFGAGHNRAIRIVDSRYHAIINPDIELRGDVFSALYAFLEQRPEALMAQPVVRFPNGEVQHHPKLDPTFADLFIRLFLKNKFPKRQSRYQRLDMDPEQPFSVAVASGCFLFARTEALQEEGGFDERFFLYFEDNDLSRRLRQKGYIMQMPSRDVIHYWNRDSRKSRRILMIMLGSAMKYFWKWKFKKRNDGMVEP